ncbi:Protein of unknown function [Kaistia soli DSM 19436]|uniref:DUF2283 domain-containing protein n=1 Tax=Kaistia soli DSM 19436 TaxID=1122133 RepID=A0A1M4VJP8_9HYPH|nr:DUF2283 domain-containing protein [Kaistia soli]SHE69110.1 Protein of unknown function [Kaistia soli DSM 19436]
MNDISTFIVRYDRTNDVLYIATKSAPAARGVQDAWGILWRYAGDGDLIGATIMDFDELWGDRTAELAAKLASSFDIPEPQTEITLDHILDR